MQSRNLRTLAVWAVSAVSLLWAAGVSATEYVELTATGGVTIRCYVDGVEQEGTHNQAHTRDARAINLKLSNPDSVVSCDHTETVVAGLTAEGRALLEGVTPDPEPEPEPEPPTEVELGSVLLTWIPPTHNTDGSELTDLFGYRLYWRAESETGYPNKHRVSGADTTEYLVENLPLGIHCFVLAAINDAKIESAYSNEVCKEAQ